MKLEETERISFPRTSKKTFQDRRCWFISLQWKVICKFLNQYFGEGNGTALQHSCLENPMDGGAWWWAAVHGVAKSRTQLSDFTFTFHFHALEKEMATHSSVLAWRIPGTGQPGGLLSMGSHRVRHDWSDLAAANQYFGEHGGWAVDEQMGFEKWLIFLNTEMSFLTTEEILESSGGRYIFSFEHKSFSVKIRCQ